MNELIYLPDYVIKDMNSFKSWGFGIGQFYIGSASKESIQWLEDLDNEMKLLKAWVTGNYQALS